MHVQMPTRERERNQVSTAEQLQERWAASGAGEYVRHTWKLGSGIPGFCSRLSPTQVDHEDDVKGHQGR